jgi:FkbM family methyltransferase
LVKKEVSLATKINGLKEIWQFENRWKLIFERLFFSSEKINIYRYKNLEILIDHAAGDANGAREVLTSPMYRQFLHRIKPGKINVMDLGSNNGGFPLLLKSENFEIEKLVCVELNPKTFSRMRFNIERNINCHFFPLNAALVGEAREIETALGEGGAGESIYQNGSNGNLSVVRIQGLTFDEIYRAAFDDEIVDICKIDVEGAEFEVFRAGTCEKLKQCRAVIMEIHENKERRRAEILNRIAEFGFVEKDGENKNEPGEHYVHFFENLKLR